MILIGKKTMVETQNLRIGTDAMLLLLSGEHQPGKPLAEAIRAEIIDVQDGKYIGAIISDPVSTDGLKEDDVISFGAEHVIFFLEPDDICDDCRRAAEELDEK